MGLGVAELDTVASGHSKYPGPPSGESVTVGFDDAGPGFNSHEPTNLGNVIGDKGNTMPRELGGEAEPSPLLDQYDDPRLSYTKSVYTRDESGGWIYTYEDKDTGEANNFSLVLHGDQVDAVDKLLQEGAGASTGVLEVSFSNGDVEYVSYQVMSLQLNDEGELVLISESKGMEVSLDDEELEDNTDKTKADGDDEEEPSTSHEIDDVAPRGDGIPGPNDEYSGNLFDRAIDNSQTSTGPTLHGGGGGGGGGPRKRPSLVSDGAPTTNDELAGPVPGVENFGGNVPLAVSPTDFRSKQSPNRPNSSGGGGSISLETGGKREHANTAQQLSNLNIEPGASSFNPMADELVGPEGTNVRWGSLYDVPATEELSDLGNESDGISLAPPVEITVDGVVAESSGNRATGYEASDAQDQVRPPEVTVSFVGSIKSAADTNTVELSDAPVLENPPELVELHISSDSAEIAEESTIRQDVDALVQDELSVSSSESSHFSAHPAERHSENADTGKLDIQDFIKPLEVSRPTEETVNQPVTIEQAFVQTDVVEVGDLSDVEGVAGAAKESAPVEAALQKESDEQPANTIHSKPSDVEKAPVVIGGSVESQPKETRSSEKEQTTARENMGGVAQNPKVEGGDRGEMPGWFAGLDVLGRLGMPQKQLPVSQVIFNPFPVSQAAKGDIVVILNPSTGARRDRERSSKAVGARA